MKTLFPDVTTLQNSRAWHSMDAKDKVLGRLATRAAVLLMGKHKPIWSPHLDCGDFVVVTNAGKIRLTGKKREQKEYFSHSGYPDGAKMTSVKKLFNEHPDRIITLAVKLMLPKNILGSRMLTRLKVYAAPDHPHSSQQPKKVN